MRVTQSTRGINRPQRVAVLRDSLLRLGLLAGLGNPHLLGLPTVHTTVRRTREGTITTRGTLTGNTLTGGLTALAEGGHFLAKQSNFGEQGVKGGHGEMMGFEHWATT